MVRYRVVWFQAGRRCRAAKGKPSGEDAATDCLVVLWHEGRLGDLARKAVLLSARSWGHIWPVLVGLAVFAPLLILSTSRLELLEMGDDMAAQLGLNLTRSRATLVIAAVGLTAVATASCGPIAFVALAGPQVARRLTCAPVPLISGALSGAGLLLAADLLLHRAPLQLLLPIGTMTGLCGGAYLVWLLGWGRTAQR